MKIDKKTVASAKGDITIFTLTNNKGSVLTLSSLGAGIVSLTVPDAKGEMANVVIGYADPTDYYSDGPCAGKIPGRYANRIARGKFSIDGREYSLAINNGPNALHGGPEGYMNLIWDAEADDLGNVVFTLHSPDGYEGYPGNLDVKATYTFTDNDTVTLKLQAVTDAPTVINLTNHTYWNLDGQNSGSVLDQKMWLDCNCYLPTDDTLIPTGEIAPVAGTPMDFTTLKPLAQDIKADFPALIYGKGYDNCWVINDWEPGQFKHIATLESDKSGRVLKVLTTQPAVQVYTGNWLAGSPKNPEGRSYNDYDGVAIECQSMPDSPNHPNFPSTILRPGDTYCQIIEFQLSNK